MHPSSASSSPTPPYAPHTIPQHRQYIPPYSQPQHQYVQHGPRQHQPFPTAQQQHHHTIRALGSSPDIQNHLHPHSHALSSSIHTSRPHSSPPPHNENTRASFTRPQSLQLPPQKHDQRDLQYPSQTESPIAPPKEHYFPHTSPPPELNPPQNHKQDHNQQSLYAPVVRPPLAYYSNRPSQESDQAHDTTASHLSRSNVHINEINPAPAPACTLSKQDVAILSQTYADTLSLLRKYLLASQWLLHTWALTSHPVISNLMDLDLPRCRGFRTLYVCTKRGCASFESACVLQKSATLLVPTQTTDPLILGYFVDSSVDRTQSPPPRLGKYVYCSDTQQLVKVSKVPTSSPSAASSTVLIQKMVLVSRNMVVNDFVTASFPCFDETNYQPLAQYLVHSRTLSFHTLVQTAQRAGFSGYVDDVPTLSSSDEEPHRDLGVLENSFYGVGTFGVYDGSIVPCKFPPGARGDDYTSYTPQPAFGVWAIPEHLSVCPAMQMIHLGLSQEENSMLRAQFVQAIGQISHRSSISPSIGTNQNLFQPSRHDASGLDHDEQQQCINDREDGSSADYPLRQHQGIAMNRENERNRIGQSLSEIPVHSATPMTVMFEAQELNDGRLSDEKESVGEDHATGTREKQALNVEVDQRYGRGGSNTAVEVLEQEVSSPPPMEDQIEAVVPSHRNLSGRSPLSKPLGTLTSSPPSAQVATSNYINVFGPNPSAALVQLSTPVTTATQAPLQVGVTPTTGTATFVQPAAVLVKGIAPAGFPAPLESSAGKEENAGPSSKLVKKTLPAPTRSEIVIRNRISAQRSNEKRRRKIEATKSELAFLKTTLLPQLEHRRVALATENQTLRISFMQKYQENIETFFWERVS